MKENFSILRSGAAGSTLIAGILHLSLVAGVLDRNFNTGILFLIGGFGSSILGSSNSYGLEQSMVLCRYRWDSDLHDNLASHEISR